MAPWKTIQSSIIGVGVNSAIVTEVSVPVDLDIDVYQNKIYWADNVRKQIFRANLDGSGQEVVLADSFPNLSSIAIFPTLDLMFFADIDSSLIWSCSLSGKNRKVLVNDELGSIHDLVAALPHVLKPSGRAAIITFHSTEDRIVKQSLRSLDESLIIINKKAIIPTKEELHNNPRARSAQLRIAERK
jgi:hypothetical protein